MTYGRALVVSSRLFQTEGYDGVGHFQCQKAKAAAYVYIKIVNT
jgi:hypothetical protein